jgi:large subunit ribosomal protein L10e
MCNMAKLRKGRSYSKDTKGRPYTRKSKYRSKSYVRSTPTCKVTRFDSGGKNQGLTHRAVLYSEHDVHLRHNCIEAARITVQRALDKQLPKTDYHFRIKPYPHHHLRENPLASGAGADRMSTGMKKSFGKVIGLAAKVRKNQEVMEVWVLPKNLVKAKNALQKANFKFPKRCTARIPEGQA